MKNNKRKSRICDRLLDRFGAKASKARQAQSRMKAIERMDLVSAVQTESEFQFEFRNPGHCPNPLLQLDGAGVVYGEKRVLSHLNLVADTKRSHCHTWTEWCR